MPTPKFDPRVLAYAAEVLASVELLPSRAYRPTMARAMRARDFEKFSALARAHASAQAIEHFARALSRVNNLSPSEARRLLVAVCQVTNDRMTGAMPVAETAHPAIATDCPRRAGLQLHLTIESEEDHNESPK